MKTFEEHYKESGLDGLYSNETMDGLVKETAALFWDRALLEVLSLDETQEVLSLLTEQPKQPGDF